MQSEKNIAWIPAEEMTLAAASECVVCDWVERLEGNWFRRAYSAGEHTDALKLLGSFACCTLRLVGTATASRAGHFCKTSTVTGVHSVA